jgi:hypothetical protein
MIKEVIEENSIRVYLNDKLLIEVVYTDNGGDNDIEVYDNINDEFIDVKSNYLGGALSELNNYIKYLIVQVNPNFRLDKDRKALLEGIKSKKLNSI